MKRFFFMAIALSAAVVGCTKSNLVDLPESSEALISFEPYTTKAPMTKASIMTEAELEKHDENTDPAFHVSAFVPNEYSKPFMNKDVWCTSPSVPGVDGAEGTKASWAYEGKAYWPEGDLEFVAYGLNASKALPTGSASKTIDFGTSYTEFTYTVSDLVSDQEDLIVSEYQKRSSNNGAAVNLQFKHLLSKVGFSLQTNKANDVVVTIKKVDLKGLFYTEGSVDMLKTGDDLKVDVTGKTASAKTYTLFGHLAEDNSIVSYNPAAADAYACYVGESKGDQVADPIYANASITVEENLDVSDDAPEFIEKTPVTDSDATADNRYMMLIPCTPGTADAKATIEVIYQLTDAETQTAKVELPETFKFEKGNGYEFVLKISTMAVEFDVDVIDWATGTVADSYTLTPVVE